MEAVQMDHYGRRYRWIAFLFALFVAAAVGYVAYGAGVAHGIAAASQQIGAPAPGAAPFAPYPYGWYRPWGFGFGFFFGPLFFFLAFIFVMRALAWGGPWRRYGCYGRAAGGAPMTFDDWHRRAHERMGKEPGEPPHDDDRSRG
jgi:hypothetical protein